MDKATQLRSVGIAEIEVARARIGDTIHRTRTEPSASLSDQTGVPVHLKLEHHQRTGSFKLRGATNAVLSLSDAEKARGVVGVSTGNHGRGLAYAARQNGVRCIVAMSELVPQNKIDGIRAQGAEVRIVGQSQDDAQLEVDRLVTDEGMTMIPPFDHPDIIAGQGTVGLEIAAQSAELGVVPDQVLVCCGGGGLIAGSALALTAKLPGVSVHSVEPETFDDTARSLELGRRVEVARDARSICDALQAHTPGALTFEINRRLLGPGYAVSDDEVREAMRFAFRHLKLVVEPGGAVALAAVIAGRVATRGRVTAVVISGGNVDYRLYADIQRAGSG